MKATTALLAALLFCDLSISASSRCLAVQAAAPPKEKILSLQDQELIAAVRRTDVKAVNSLLKQGADVNLIDYKVLNSKGKPFTYQNYLVPTLLMEAICFSKKSHARTALIQTLLDHGADPNAVGLDGDEKVCPITLALGRHQLATAYQILKHGADPNLTISKGFPIGGPEWEYINMPLFHYLLCDFFLSRYSEADKVALLSAMLKHGAQPDLRAANGNTALLWATIYDIGRAVPLLLAYGADVNIKNSDGETALCYAALFAKSSTTVRLLLSKGSKVNAPDKEGRTPLAWAIKYVDKKTIKTNLEVIRLLLAYGADVNTTDAYGETPLSVVMDKNETPEVLQVIALLKAAGARELPANRIRRTPEPNWRM